MLDCLPNDIQERFKGLEEMRYCSLNIEIRWKARGNYPEQSYPICCYVWVLPSVSTWICKVPWVWGEKKWGKNMVEEESKGREIGKGNKKPAAFLWVGVRDKSRARDCVGWQECPSFGHRWELCKPESTGKISLPEDGKLEAWLSHCRSCFVHRPLFSQLSAWSTAQSLLPTLQGYLVLARQSKFLPGAGQQGWPSSSTD